jgi:hypothetical protein
VIDVAQLQVVDVVAGARGLLRVSPGMGNRYGVVVDSMQEHLPGPVWKEKDGRRIGIALGKSTGEPPSKD